MKLLEKIVKIFKNTLKTIFAITFTLDVGF